MSNTEEGTEMTEFSNNGPVSSNSPGNEKGPVSSNGNGKGPKASSGSRSPGNNLKQAGKYLASAVTGVAEVGAQAANVGVQLTGSAVGVVGQVGNKALKTTGVVATQALTAVDSVAEAGQVVVSSTAQASGKIVQSTTTFVANAANVTLQSTGNLYGTTIRQTALLARTGIKAGTEGLAGLLEIAGEKQQTFRERKVAKEVAGRELSINRSVSQEYQDQLVKSLTELTVGIIATINTYLSTLDKLRHLIYIEKHIDHIWRSNSGIAKPYITFRRRTQNANNVEDQVRSIWEGAQLDKEKYKSDMQQFIRKYTLEFQRILLQGEQKRKSLYQKVLVDASNDIVQFIQNIQKNYEGKQRMLEAILEGKMANLQKIAENIQNLKTSQIQQAIFEGKYNNPPTSAEGLQYFIKHLPIDDKKYDLLISNEGLDGYKLISQSHGNVVLQYKGNNILPLRGDNKSEIIQELNNLKTSQI